ncbi:MAG: exodeoxyribonuclease VII large subunit, partial [Terracidiphilus sp.]
QQYIAELAAAVLRHDPRRKLAQAREELAACLARLSRIQERKLHESMNYWSALDAQLQSLSPLAVLERGYALVLDGKNKVIRSTLQIGPGDRVITRLSDGAFISFVESSATTKK